VFDVVIVKKIKAEEHGLQETRKRIVGYRYY